MNILLDAMGGDNAPDANIKGAIKAITQIKADVTLIGKEEIIRAKVKEFTGKEIEEVSERLKIKNATETIEMEDQPTVAIKHKKDSSMVVGFKMLKNGEGDVFISAGNSGALLAGATLLVGRIKGIDRPALAGILPAYKSQLLLIDSGSNTNCKPINLLQFAQMSTIYLRNTFGIEHPAIGLLNIGTEETKGNELVKESYKLLKEKSEELGLNFIGNVEEDGKNAKLSYGFDHDPFYVPEEVYADFKKNVKDRGTRAYKKWLKTVEEYAEKYPEEYKEYKNAIEGNYHLDITELQKEFKPGYTEATRNISHRIIQEVAAQNPTFLSGTADLSSSTKTSIQGEGRFSCENYTGRNVYFGIREFAMVSIMNGMTLHKGVKISAGGFLVFSDYFKAALRMGSLQECPIILPLSHDSIAVGEDGPTHQPVEQLAMLRSSIDVEVLRPADANEMLASWKIAVETKNMPVALILTRQPVENLTNSTYEDVLHGAYIARKESGDLEGIIIASGSEVGLAIHAQEELEKQGHSVRVVSMPSMNLFDAQTDEYKESVLPNSCRKRLSVEMLSDFGWHKYVGLDGKTMCVDTFGASAPASRVIKEYGFTVENVVKEYNSL